MEIQSGTSSGISPEGARRLEERAAEVTSLLLLIPEHLQLHELSFDAAEKLLLVPDSPGWRLWDVVIEALAESGRGRPPSNKRVATSKLLARKRPHLFPIRDSRTVDKLGRPANWWVAWWEALYNDPQIVDDLSRLRQRSGATHLSLLRVADIVPWK